MHVRLLFFSAAIFVAAPLFGATISATTTGDGTASGNFFFYLSSAGVSFLTPVLRHLRLGAQCPPLRLSLFRKNS